MGLLRGIREGLREWKAALDARHAEEGRKLLAEREERQRVRKREGALERMPYAEYLKSPEWRARRAEALRRDGHACTECGSTVSLQVHHTTYRRRGRESLSDLETLCRDCHRGRHGRDESEDTTRFLVDSPTRAASELEECFNSRGWRASRELTFGPDDGERVAVAVAIPGVDAEYKLMSIIRKHFPDARWREIPTHGYWD